jgi:hypothetical protein
LLHEILASVVPHVRILFDTAVEGTRCGDMEVTTLILPVVKTKSRDTILSCFQYLSIHERIENPNFINYMIMVCGFSTVATKAKRINVFEKRSG